MKSKAKSECEKRGGSSGAARGSASLAMQEIQTAILLFIWSNATDNGLLMLGTATLGLCYIIGGIIRKLKE